MIARPESAAGGVLTKLLSCLAIAVLGAALAGSCAEKKGALILAVSTDMKAPKDVNAVSVTISTNGAIKHSFIGRVTPEGDVLLPATLAIVEPDDKGASIRIRVMAFQNRRARVMRDVRTTAPSGGRTALLRVPLNFIDDGKVNGAELPAGVWPDPAPTGAADFDFFAAFQPPCPDVENQTIIDGECKDSYVGADTLPDFDANVVGDSTKSDACFDIAACFRTSSAVTPEPAACTLPRGGSDPARIDFALVTPDTGECVRPGECYVPIDHGPGGWTAEGDRIQLPSFVCAQLAGKRLRLVESDGACAAKEALTPICTPAAGEVPPPPGGDAGMMPPADDAGMMPPGTEGGFVVAAPTPKAEATAFGGAASLTVKLATAPTADVTIPIMLSKPELATLASGGAPLTALVFTPASWDSPQSVTVTGKEAPSLDATFAVKLGPASSGDARYGGKTAPDITFTYRGATELAAGYAHTCVRFGTGVVKCWGQNDVGQLGLGDTVVRGNDPGELGAALPAVALGAGRKAMTIAAGNDHTCAILDNGALKCWGRNQEGQLGLGNTQSRGDGPGEMGDALPAVDLGVGRTAKAIALGAYFSCAILDTGSVKCWGIGGVLGLGNGNFYGVSAGEMGDALPVVDLGAGRTATALMATNYHACALLDNGALKCWGQNDAGQLGQGDTLARGDGPGEMGDALLPIALPAGRTVLALGTSKGSQTCVVLDDKTIACWGANDLGQLGIGNTNNIGDGPGEMGNALVVVPLAGGIVSGVTGGYRFNCSIATAVKCFGWSAEGELGQGDQVGHGRNPGEIGAAALPFIDLGPGAAVRRVSSGNGHTCVVLSDYRIKCWGANDSGQLGLGDTANRGDQPNEMGAQLPFVDITP